MGDEPKTIQEAMRLANAAAYQYGPNAQIVMSPATYDRVKRRLQSEAEAPPFLTTNPGYQPVFGVPVVVEDGAVGVSIRDGRGGGGSGGGYVGGGGSNGG